MKDNLKLEKHLNLHEHKAVDRFHYKGFEVYISEGGPYFEKSDEFPLGWYEGAYALGKNEKVMYYFSILFDVLHDAKEHTPEARRRGRINSTKRTAREHIDELVAAHG